MLTFILDLPYYGGDVLEQNKASLSYGDIYAVMSGQSYSLSVGPRFAVRVLKYSVVAVSGGQPGTRNSQISLDLSASLA
jgi:hypothetical protein